MINSIYCYENECSLSLNAITVFINDIIKKALMTTKHTHVHHQCSSFSEQNIVIIMHIQCWRTETDSLVSEIVGAPRRVFADFHRLLRVLYIGIVL